MFFKKKQKIAPYSTVVGKDAEFTGNLRFAGGIHIDGKIIGDVTAFSDTAAPESVITIASTGVIEGNVSAPQVIIDGTVIGDVRAAHRAVLASSARIHGTLFYGKLSLDDGAEILGRMVRLGADGQPITSLNKQLAPSANAESLAPGPSRRMLDKLGTKEISGHRLPCTGWDETYSALQLLGDTRATVDGVLAKHINCTEVRAGGYRKVLCIQSRIELDYSEDAARFSGDAEGHGPRRNMPLYPLLAMTASHIPLGTLAVPGLETNARTIRKVPLSPQASIDDAAWTLGLMRVSELSARLPSSNLTYIADLETAFKEILAVATSPDCHADWLIRIPYRDVAVADGGSLFETLEKALILGEIGFEQTDTKTRRTRVVRQNVKVAQVILDAQALGLPGARNPSVNALLATEINPPAGDEAQDWLLLTNLHTRTSNDAVEALRWYLCSRQADTYYKILKTGIKIEERQLEARARAKLFLAYHLTLAWRVFYLMTLGKESHEALVDQVFTSEEWKAIYLISQRQPAPEVPPDILTLVRMVASLGGFISRGGEDYPGPSTIWVGLQRATQLVETFQDSASE